MTRASGSTLNNTSMCGSVRDSQIFLLDYLKHLESEGAFCETRGDGIFQWPHDGMLEEHRVVSPAAGKSS